jgi:hypothetical protein
MPESQGATNTGLLKKSHPDLQAIFRPAKFATSSLQT